MTTEGALAWLLEPENPSARYLTLIHLLDRSADDVEVAAARAAIPSCGPARAILDAQWQEGYWVRPGVGYSPKHRATVWQVIFLAALGAPLTEAIARACRYLLDHSLGADGQFWAGKTEQGAVVCLNGNLLRAFSQLGFEHERIERCREALASRVARDGFCCLYNGPAPRPVRMVEGLPCAWGAVKVLGAFARVRQEERSPAVQAAIEAGLALLRGGDLAAGGYPDVRKPSPTWRKFGFPLGFTSEVLEALQVLGQLGVCRGPGVEAAIGAVRKKQLPSGRWALEHTPRSSWGDFGKVGEPNKWVTFRALDALRLCTGGE